MKKKKAQEITDRTRKSVLDRQRTRSISGAYLLPGKLNCHHFISVGSGGVGYEWNVVALTPSEHRQLHDGSDIKCDNGRTYTNKQFKTLIRNHLILHYDGWSEKNCKYKKNYEEEDYGVTRIPGHKTAASRTVKKSPAEYDIGSGSKEEL